MSVNNHCVVLLTRSSNLSAAVPAIQVASSLTSGLRLHRITHTQDLPSVGEKWSSSCCQWQQPTTGYSRSLKAASFRRTVYRKRTVAQSIKWAVMHAWGAISDSTAIAFLSLSLQSNHTLWHSHGRLILHSETSQRKQQLLRLTKHCLFLPVEVFEYFSFSVCIISCLYWKRWKDWNSRKITSYIFWLQFLHRFVTVIKNV